MRCFISIDPPKDVKEYILGLQESLPEFMGKKTEQENLHLTLKFLGEIDSVKLERVKNELKKIKLKDFDVVLEEIGVFSLDYTRIIWIHLRGSEELQKEIDSYLKDLFFVEKRFMGHLTIARVKSIKDKKKFLEELDKLKIKPIKFKVSNFILKESILKKEGPVYKEIEKYTLES